MLTPLAPARRAGLALDERERRRLRDRAGGRSPARHAGRSSTSRTTRRSSPDAAHVRQIVERYSSFIQFPIELNGTRLNTIQAIWARNKSEIPDADYNAFYQYVGHDHDDPLLRLHFTADAPLAIQALLFVPKQNWENMGLGRTEPGVNLYCRKVLIKDRMPGLFPEWLRFLKGVVDSEDLPLNISRETMQDSALLEKLNKVLTGRFLKFLDETAEKDAALLRDVLRRVRAVPEGRRRHRLRAPRAARASCCATSRPSPRRAS